MRHDGGVALADAGGFNEDDIKARDFACGNRIRQRFGDFGAAGVARGERAHVNVFVIDRIHANAIAEQRAAGLTARRIDRDDGDLELIVLINAEATNQLVGQRRLPGTTGAGDAEARRVGFCGEVVQLLDGRRISCAGLKHGDPTREGVAVAGFEGVEGEGFL